MRHRKTWGTVALTGALALVGTSTAVADNIQDSITGTGSVMLVAGDNASTGSAFIRVVGNKSSGDTDSGCNFDSAGEHLTLTVHTPAGVSVNHQTLTFTDCEDDQELTFKASSTAVSGSATVSYTGADNTSGGTFVNQVDIPITVTQPVPQNTAPTVSVTDVNSGSYEIGSEPTPACTVSDAEQPGASASPQVDRSGLVHGLGTVSVSCGFTDDGGLSDSDTATYTVVDTGNPTIGAQISPAAPDGSNGWYTSAPTVTFDCADADGSGIDSCLVDGDNDSNVTLGEGASQRVSGTATDWAGNTASTALTGLNVDLTDPTASWDSALAGSYYFGFVPAAPTCTAVDAVSGPEGCSVSGYDTAIGQHTVTATATDRAGRSGTVAQTYDVLAWTAKGFYQPVDMGNVVNTVKAGSTVPVKFELFAGNTELTDTSLVTMSAKKAACDTQGTSDAIELLSSGNTSLRYDTTGGQYVYNWKTPTTAGSCYQLSMTAPGLQSPVTAMFKLK